MQSKCVSVLELSIKSFYFTKLPGLMSISEIKYGIVKDYCKSRINNFSLHFSVTVQCSAL